MQANQQQGRCTTAWTEIMRGEIPHTPIILMPDIGMMGPQQSEAGRDVGGRAEAEHSGVEAERKEQDRPAERRKPYTTTSREVLFPISETPE